MGKLDIAKEYLLAPAYTVEAVPAFKALAAESTISARRLRRYQVTVTEVANSEPYPSSRLMFEDIKVGLFLVSNLNCEHPQWTAKQNIDFRICHDILGHFMVASGFSWKGELAAYVSQCKWYSPLAVEALFTEIVGQTACYQVNKEFPAQKVILLEGRHDSVDVL